MSEQSIGTRCVQAGYTPGDGEPRQIPIVQSTTFKYATSEHMGQLFDLEASGYFYTRLQNPTNDAVAAKIAALEGGAAAMLTRSGQAANFFSLFNICEAGSHIVASSAIYGGTYNLIAHTMAKMGVESTFVSPECTPEELEAAFRPKGVRLESRRAQGRARAAASHPHRKGSRQGRTTRRAATKAAPTASQKQTPRINLSRPMAPPPSLVIVCAGAMFLPPAPASRRRPGWTWEPHRRGRPGNPDQNEAYTDKTGETERKHKQYRYNSVKPPCLFKNC